MKKIFLLSSILIFMCSFAYADAWYIVDINNKVIAKVRYRPNQSDLDSRNEVAIRSDLNIDLKDAEYRASKLVKHVKTQEEKDKRNEGKNKTSDMTIIKNKAFKDACLKLKAEGVIFKVIKCTDFN